MKLENAIKIIKNQIYSDGVQKHVTYIDIDNIIENDCETFIEAIDTVLKELDKEKALHHNIRLELMQIKKDLDFEPWSIYKVDGQRLFNIERLLNKE